MLRSLLSFYFGSRVAGSNPAGGEIVPEPKRRFIAQSLSWSPFHRLGMTEVLLKGRKTLTHPSIHIVTSSISFAPKKKTCIIGLLSKKEIS